MKRKYSILSPALIFLLVELTLMLLIMFYRDSDGLEVVFLAGAAIAVMLGAMMLFYFRVFIPAYKISLKLKRIEKGEIASVEESERRSELGVIENTLHVHLERLSEMIRVMKELGKGNIESDFGLSSEKDELGKAISMLRESIISSNAEMTRRRAEDEQQNWASQGLAKFGEVLRNFEQDVAYHSNHFIKELVAYLEMEVGGLFLVRKDQNKHPYLELGGAYAFDREKRLAKRFEMGEGLVGRCAIEKESIIITDVPKEYIKIRSGLGEDQPSTLVLIPILLDEEVLGVIEIASFNEVPSYKIEFLNSLGSSIAASLSKLA